MNVFVDEQSKVRVSQAPGPDVDEAKQIGGNDLGACPNLEEHWLGSRRYSYR